MSANNGHREGGPPCPPLIDDSGHPHASGGLFHFRAQWSFTTAWVDLMHFWDRPWRVSFLALPEYDNRMEFYQEPLCRYAISSLSL